MGFFFSSTLVEKLGYLGVVAFCCQQEAVTLTQEDSVTGVHLFKAPGGSGDRPRSGVSEERRALSQIQRT